jgi:hypothetical protein
MTRQRRFIAILLQFVLYGFCAGGLSRGQNSIPLFPGSPRPNAGERLEVEQLEIRKFGAIPNEIHRKTGRFLLVLANHGGAASTAGFLVESSLIGDLKLGPNPLLHIGGAAASDAKHRGAALFDAPPGSYDLKDAATGKIICKIIID